MSDVTHAIVGFARWLKIYNITPPRIVFEKPKDFAEFSFRLRQETTPLSGDVSRHDTISKVVMSGIPVTVEDDPFPRMLDRLNDAAKNTLNEDPKMDVSPTLRAGFEAGIRMAVRIIEDEARRGSNGHR